MRHDPTRNRHHGAGWLTKLLYLIQGLFLVMIGVIVLWLIFSFPLWNHQEPIYKLPLEIVLRGDPGVLPDFVGDDGIRSLQVQSVGAELRVALANPWLHWLYSVLRSLPIVLALVSTILLRRIVQSIAEGRAFGLENAARLRWIGLLMLVEALALPGFFAFLSSTVVSHVSIAGGKVALDLARQYVGGDFITGWVMLILSEVFRRGAAMEEEQSLTV